MRGVSTGFARGLMVLSLTVMLAAPMQAASNDDATWIGIGRDRIVKIVKIIKKLGVRTFGDLLGDPRP